MAITLDPIVSSGEALAIPATGTSSKSLPLTTGTGQGGRMGSFQTLLMITASGSGLQYGSFKSLPVITGSGAGLIGRAGASSLDVPLITGSGAAVLYPTGGSQATLPLITGSGVAGEQPVSSLPLIFGAGDGITGVVTNIYNDGSAIPAITAASIGDPGNIGTSANDLPEITGVGYGPNGSEQDVPLVTGTGEGLAGSIGFSAAVMPLLTAASVGTVPYVGESSPTLPEIVASSAGILGGVGASNTTLLQIIVAAQGHSGSIGTSIVTLPLVVESGSGYGPTTGLSVNVSIPLIIASATGRQSADAFGSIVMNTSNKALTEYTNYEFNSFAKFNGVYLGANDSGIFALTGADDDGVFIDAAMRAGITDFSTSKLKRIDRMVVGYRTDGDLSLLVTTDEDTVTEYKLKDTGKAGIHSNHVPIGKGLKARYWQFEIRNKNGCDFDIDMMEVIPNVLSRRVGGGDA